MTDRELLELAAKAARLTARGGDTFGGPLLVNLMYVACDGVGEWDLWDPLTDDGDALRLAVKLRIGVQCHQERGDYVLADDGDGHECCLSFGPEGDPYAATRRAIVRAAAEIGRTM